MQKSPVHALRPALRLLQQTMDRPVARGMGCAAALVLAGSGLAAAAPLALKELVDAIAAESRGEHQAGLPALVSGMIYLAIGFSSRLATDLRPRISGQVEQRVIAALRQRFMKHLLRLPMPYIISRRSGELLHCVDLAAAGAQLLISHLTNSIAPVLVELAVMGIILAHLDQPMLLALLAAAASLYLAVFALGAARLRPIAQALSSASLDVHGHLGDGIAHAETLRCFGAEEQAETALAGASSRLRAHWHSFNGLTASVAVMASAVFTLTLAACLAISADAVTSGTMSVGGLVLAIVYTMQMVHPLEVLGGAARDLVRAAGFMQPLFCMLSEPTEPTCKALSATSAAPTQPGEAPSLRFEDVHFGYAAGRPVIRGLSLEITAGSTTAIVGRSGCGKSSLIRLLLRLYEPQQGRILLNGRPLDAIATADLRAMIGLVPQDVGLLHATAAANIALGARWASRQSIRQAACWARIDEVIAALPAGYETLLGERAQMLSGGERQRLSIARAMLRRPALWLLDEPTSMLDGRTEAEVVQCLRQTTGGCTTVIVAHRLSTVMHADQIVVLDSGQVHEQGTHDALLAQDGLYAQLWRQQTEGAARRP